MAEQVASCMICGQQRKLAVWHESGAGVCAPCRYKAEAAPAGYALFDVRYGTFYRGHVYSNWTDARKAFEGIVWHSRERYEVRPVMVGAASGGTSDG